jgi:hypothetical protein
MKFTKILFLFLASGLLFSACSKDEETLEGVWDLQRVETSNCQDPTENSIIDFSANGGCQTLGPISVCVKATTEFKNGTYTTVFTTTTTTLGFNETETDTETGTYTVSDKKITVCDSFNVCRVGEFTISGNILTINAIDDESKCKAVQTMKKR